MPRILHVIDSLQLGGAESIVANSISMLHDFQHSVATLSKGDDFGLKSKNFVRCLNHSRKSQIFRSALKLRRFIIEEEIEIVHAHLFWSTILARIASIGLNVKFYFTIHTIMSKDSFDNSRIMKFIEQVSYTSSQTVIGVSKSVLNDYDNTIGIKGKSHVLYNFVDDEFFERSLHKKVEKKPLRLVAVGNIKPLKNYDLLIEVFSQIDNSEFSLDIFGEGSDLDYYSKIVKEKDLNIRFKGKSNSLPELLSNYDIFIMPSFYEGFGIAPLEAMASGLPVLLSDIDTFHEIAPEVALFFDPNIPSSLISLLSKIQKGEVGLEKLATNGRARAFEISSKKNYVEKLRNIYLSDL